MAGEGRAAAAIGEKGLYDPVFERMERHDHEPAIGPQHGFSRAEPGHELGQLVVHQDP